MDDLASRRPVLDSDVLIDYLRGKGPGLRLVRELGPLIGYQVTAVTAFELALGRSYGSNPAPVDALLAAPMLMLTRRAGIRGGNIFRQLRSRREAIEVRDALQAGICLEADAPLVTRNAAHFDRVGGLLSVHPDDWPSR